MVHQQQHGQHQPTITDFDLHGIVGVRLCDAGADDVRVVGRQLGPIQSPLQREPDITIRFVDRLPIRGRIRYLGVDDVGFTDDAFLVLRSKHKTRSMVQIPIEDIGGRCEIVCESGLPAVPLLIPILNLTALAKGALPLHAAAFTYQGTGALVTGWSKGGKTEALLAFMAHGASYVGDEWVYLSEGGQRMFGIPEPIHVWDWHLKDMPQYRAMVGAGDRLRLRTLSTAVRGMSWFLSRKRERRSSFTRLVSRAQHLLKRQLNVQLPPRKLFADQSRSLSGTPDKVFFVASHEPDDITLQRVDAQEVAQRMVFSLQEERMDLFSTYMKFRFAFPDKRNDLIERMEERQRELLVRALAAKEAYAVYHPYPVSIPDMYEVMRPALEGSAGV